MKQNGFIRMLLSDIKSLGRGHHPLKKNNTAVGVLTHGACLYNTQVSVSFSFGLIAHKSLHPAAFQPMYSTNHTNLDKNAEQLLLSPLINVIFAIGPLATYALYKASERLGIKKLVFFAGVAHPIELGIIKSYAEPSNFCGVLDEFSLNDRFDTFLNLFPDVTNVVLISDPSQGHIMFERDKINTSNFLTEKGFNVIDMPISAQSQSNHQLDVMLKSLQASSAKTVMVAMPDTYVMSSIEKIAKVARTYNIPLFSFDTEAAKEGIVSCASGVDSNELGSYVSDSLIPLLYGGPAHVGLSEHHALPQITIVSTHLFPHLSPTAQEWCMKNAHLITTSL